MDIQFIFPYTYFTHVPTSGTVNDDVTN